MTKDSKLAHISDSASGGKGESMATEIRLDRAMKWLRSDEGRAAYSLAYNKTAHLSSPYPWLPDLLAAFAASECSRISDIPAQGSEARRGVDGAGEGNTADEQKLKEAESCRDGWQQRWAEESGLREVAERESKGLASRVEELERAVALMRKFAWQSFQTVGMTGHKTTCGFRGCDCGMVEYFKTERLEFYRQWKEYLAMMDDLLKREIVPHLEYKDDVALAQPSGNTPGKEK